MLSVSITPLFPVFFAGGILVILIVTNLLYAHKYRPWKISRGYPTKPFNHILRGTLRLIFREDTRKIGKTSLTYRRITWLTLLAVLILGTLGLWVPLAAVTLIYLTTTYTRTKTVFAERNLTQQRMFEVANSEFRYPRGADMQPWSYVKIKSWENIIEPGETIVSFPASWRVDDPRKKEEFENHFSGTVSPNNTWSYDWDGPHGIVTCRPVSHLPSMAPYPGSAQHPWNIIPLGVGVDGEVTIDVLESPHALICGATGGGKSTAQRTFIAHCVQHPNEWRFLGIDLKRVELSLYRKYDNVVMGIATTVQDALEVLRFVDEQMMERYATFEALGKTAFIHMPDPPPAIMIMIDEAFMLMAPGADADENPLKAECTTIIGNIARLGRAAGIYLVTATQRPDAKVIFGEIRANHTTRYAAGRLTRTASDMILETTAGTRIPGEVKGRGIVSIHGNEYPLQGYYMDESWIDNWLKDNPPQDATPTTFIEPEHDTREQAQKALQAIDELDDIFMEDLEPTVPATPPQAPKHSPTLPTSPVPLPRPQPLPLPVKPLEPRPQLNNDPAPATPKKHWDDDMENLFANIPEE